MRAYLSRTSAPTPVLIRAANGFQIILGKVRPITSPGREPSTSSDHCSLFNGEQVGDGTGPGLDIAVDPVDGTTLTAKSLPDAVSVLGVSPRGTMFDPGPAVYMHKLVVPAAVAEQVDLDAPIADTLGKIARHADRRVSDL